MFIKKIFALPLIVVCVVLSACQTSSLTEEEKAPVAPSSAAFTGELRSIDKTQSRISFTGKSNIISHEGKFNDYNATVMLDAAEPANLEKAKIEAEIDMTSVEADAAGLQGHLAKEDFFSVAEYPTATFVSTMIVSKGNNQYDVTGDLTIKGTTKTITVPAEITAEYLTAQFDLPREDFGIGNNAYGQKLLEPTVPVDIKLVFMY